MNKSQLIELVKQQPDADSWMYVDSEGLYRMTTEWLTGTFAGRSFVSKESFEDCAEQMINYFNRHIGHDSVVGEVVKDSGYPNIDKIKSYLEAE